MQTWRAFKEQEQRARAEYWRAALEVHGGSIARAAQAAGIHRSVLYRTLANAGVAIPASRHGKRGNASWRELERASH